MFPRWRVTTWLLWTLYQVTWMTRWGSSSSPGSPPPPEASSTLLKMHRLYLQRPPHDTALYDVLHVSPNATASQISQSYRRLSRRFHPDKQLHRKDEINSKEQWERVQLAYEVLRDDGTRLPYHQYGLTDMSQALLLFTGQGRSDLTVKELMRLMGYYDDDDKKALPPPKVPSSRRLLRTRRIYFLAADLVETIRPVVEGTITEASLADAVVTMCDRIKKLPLGAQILRCIGRAYRYSGQKVLRRYRRHRDADDDEGASAGVKTQSKAWWVPSPDWPHDVSDHVRDRLRSAKHIFNAAVATGRVVLKEQTAKAPAASKPMRRRTQQCSDYGGDFGEIPVSVSREDTDDMVGFLEDDSNSELGINDDEDVDDPMETDYDIKQSERRKADKALLESMQVEALWKLSKIDLDRTVREACDMLLSGEYFFLPSHQWSSLSSGPSSGSRPDRPPAVSGWVGSSGQAINHQQGRLRAASLLVLMGDIMVQRSKEGTSWLN